MRKWLLLPALFAALGCADSAPEPETPPPSGEPQQHGLAPEGATDMLDVTMNRIDGTPEPLDAYRGQVVMVVNVASKCGLTPQYDQLESLYEKYKDRGFVVLGFPANDFNGQEPGTNEEIATFCRTEYGVSFPMYEKISVIGEGAHPLFKQLAAASEEPSWNFTKYLIDREGRLVERIEPRTTPDDPAVIEKVESLLEG